MSSSIANSFDEQDGGSPAGSSRPFDDGYEGYDPRLSSQRFESFSNFAESESVKDSDSPVFTSQAAPEGQSPPSIYVSDSGFGADAAGFAHEADEEPLDSGFAAPNGPVLPPPSEMLRDEGYALREWRRENAIRLEEKEKREKEVLAQIIEEAEEYKIEFHKKVQIACETNKSSNRDREKVFLAGLEKFHAEADKDYWKSIAEFIPKEVPTIEKKGKKDKDKKPSITVVQGPKPGKPTDLSRMRQLLVKLKHNTPNHLKHAPVQVSASAKDTKSETASASEPAAVPISREPVSVA
ncbi:OLC1v1026768C1 [Oldenlandia corymbosa var. corymbosa]|uniref:Clathrin light chain n=1 Tax=Oldenlandia corymbosa var. corymbosa TaxID=529605 RepID=A0AAV1C933_OLDCO|nr:OLC1v1026768C1 [Oldenlandia corymbosa var. corymbosa]